MRGQVRLAVVFTLAALLLLFLIPLQLLALLIAKLGWTTPCAAIPVLFHRCALKILGIRLNRNGRFSKHRPLLLVANHVSWLDIVVLGAVGRLSFVAKSDMRSWPLFGNLARLQRTVFVERDRRRTVGDQANAIADRMTAREIMVLFPEGTTSDGNSLLPFKTPLFEAVKIALKQSPVETAMVQSCAIDYERLHGLPIGRAERPHVAWPGEVGLGESLLSIARQGALDVTVKLAEPIEFTENANRKAVAAKAARELRAMLAT